MKSRRVFVVIVSCCLLGPFSVAYGGTVHGTVKNGTTGKFAAGVEVVLIQLQGGMQPVLNSKSDAQGQFSFDYPGIGAQPMLIRAIYRGINFHQPLPPGRTDLEVEVFEPSRDPKTISVPTHFVIFQPNGSTLVVGEEYSIKNDSQPAQAYFREDGNFDFALPPGATLKQVGAQGPSGMPVIQTPIDRGKDRYSVAYAFRPGDNGIRYSYELPYPGSAATVKLPTVYPGARLVVVAAPSVRVTGDGLQSAGQEQGMSLYDRDSLAANSVLSVSVSGTAPPPSGAEGDSDGATQGRDAQQGGPANSVTIQTIPGRLDDLKWPLVGGFLGVFAILAVMLARKPIAVVAGAPGDSAQAPAGKATSLPSPKSTPSNGNMGEVDAAVGAGLDALKDAMFRLELRRQAGTISEQDYGQERARAEKVLRDLVRG